MAKLTAKTRKALPKSKFGLPGGTKGSGGKPAYPMQDRRHAGLAKARATAQERKGNITKAQENRIDAKANRVLGKKGTSSKRK